MHWLKKGKKKKQRPVYVLRVDHVSQGTRVEHRSYDPFACCGKSRLSSELYERPLCDSYCDLDFNQPIAGAAWGINEVVSYVNSISPSSELRGQTRSNN